MIKKMASILLICIVVALVGCGKVTTSTKKENATQGVSSTYKYSKNARFKIVSTEKIDDGTTFGTIIYQCFQE